MKCHLEACAYNAEGWCRKRHNVMVADGRCGWVWREKKNNGIEVNPHWNVKENLVLKEEYVFDADVEDITMGDNLDIGTCGD